MLNLSVLVNNIKQNSDRMQLNDVVIRNINTIFEQTTNIPSFFEKYYPEVDIKNMHNVIYEPLDVAKETVEEQPTKKLNFVAGQILELPNKLSKCLPNFHNLCLYGVSRIDSFITSIVLITNKEFMFYSTKQKDDTIKNKKMEYALNFRNYYRDYKYQVFKDKRMELEDQIINETELNDISRWFIANYYNVNIVILNLKEETYTLTCVWNSDYPIAIMINEDDVYIPLLNTQSENIFPSKIISDISAEFREKENPLITKYVKFLMSKKNDDYEDIEEPTEPIEVMANDVVDVVVDNNIEDPISKEDPKPQIAKIDTLLLNDIKTIAKNIGIKTTGKNKSTLINEIKTHEKFGKIDYKTLNVN